MLNVGLTGGIASGKSTVARMLAGLGACLIDFDQMAHASEEPGGPVWQQIVRHFGEGILRADRTIDRRRLGEAVFADRRKRELLNSLVHPALIEEWLRRLAAIRAACAAAIVVSDVPLLIEAGMTGMVDLVLLVDVAPEVQIERLMARDGFSREEAKRRLAAQMPIGEKRRFADILICNGGSPEQTRQRVSAVWEELQIREKAQRETTGGP